MCWGKERGMSRYKLHYTEIKQLNFNKKSTLQKFMATKAYKVIGLWEKKDNHWFTIEWDNSGLLL